MTDHRVVMQMALDTLEGFSPLDVCRDVHHHRNDYHGVLENCPVYERHKQTITDLRAAIAQPEQPAPSSALKKLLFKIDGLAGSGMIPWQIEDAYADYAKSIAQPKAKT